MSEYEVLSPEEAETVRVEKPGPTILDTLRAGKMVFRPGLPGVGVNSPRLRAEGLRLRTKRGERGGVAGVYWWAEPIEPIR